MTGRDAPNPRTSPWLGIAAPVGKVAAWFLIAACIAGLLAPLVFLLDLSRSVDPTDPGAPLALLFSDPGYLRAIADLLGVVGVAILACAVFLVLVGLVRAERKVPLEAYALGMAALACLIAWGPTMAFSGGLARGPVTDVEAAAATGGWSLAALLLLAASLAYLFLTLRLERGRTRKLTPLRWPAYAAVNLLGSAVIAAFFESAAGGARDPNAFGLGLSIKVVLVPLMGVWAYADLRDRFPVWARVAVCVAAASASPPAEPAEDGEPPPPPPVGKLVRRLPPPPEEPAAEKPPAEDREEVTREDSGSSPPRDAPPP